MHYLQLKNRQPTGLKFPLSFGLVLAGQINSLSSLSSGLVAVANALVPLLFGLAVLGFMWGVIKYVFAAGPEKLDEARNYMIFGIIGIAVMLAAWALALFVKNSFFPQSNLPENVVGMLSGGPNKDIHSPIAF
jgi:hypothetical protein